MSNDNEKKPLTLSPRGKLELKKTVEAGQVRQSFPHGRSKVVTVEHRKKRSFSPGTDALLPKVGKSDVDAIEALTAATAAATSTAMMVTPPPPVTVDLSSIPSLAGLTEEERQHRYQALQAAVRAEEDARRQAEIQARRKVEEEVRRVADAERKKREAEEAAARAVIEEETRKVREAEEARRKAEAPPEPPVVEAPPPEPVKPAAPVVRPQNTTVYRPQQSGPRPAGGMTPGQAAAAGSRAARPPQGGAARPAAGQGAAAAGRITTSGGAAAAGRVPGGQGGYAGNRTTTSGGAAAAGRVPGGPGGARPAGAAGAGYAGAGNKPASKVPVLPPKDLTPPEGEEPRKVRRTTTEDEEERRKSGAAKAAAKAPVSKKVVDPKRRGKLTISSVLDDEEGARGRSVAAMRRAAQKERRKQQQQFQAQEKVVRDVIIPDTITVQELANRMAERAPNVIKALMKMGVMATINQVIDADTAQLVAEEFGHAVKRVSDADVEVGLESGPDSDATLTSRAPVVTVMGHVDHGKTSLLDALRETDVVSGEAGGITQHIGAYQVTMSTGQKITFIDTPGHEAFTAMRARGAKVTDIVVLVVAADDGIMPQTIEAIRHAKAADVPIVVAINKIDKPGADPARVRTDLLSHNIVVEEMGGDVQSIELSAKKRLNLDKLEEAILLQAEILDLKANRDRFAEGTIVEAKIEKGRGPVATVLVKRGTLKVGDIFVAGSEWGRVRAMIDDHGNRVEQAGPSVPVEILGLQGVPAAGDDLIVVDDEQKAREVSAYRQRKEREAQAIKLARGTMEQMFAKIQAGEAKELPVVIKGDVQGSVEALIGTLEKVGTSEVKVRVLHAAVGAISESDITLAKASEALVIGFNVRANPQAREMARRDTVDIRYYSIIYDVAEDIKLALTGMLSPVFKEKFIGYAEIRSVFNITKVGKVAGCMVTEGTIKRGCKVRLLRDNVVIHEGDLGQLKRFKDDVKEVREGFECGMSFTNYQAIEIGDVFECYEMEQIAVQL